MHDNGEGMLEGVVVVERSRGVAAAYAGRLLAVMGATVISMEDPSHPSELRQIPPLASEEPPVSALFHYLSVNKKNVTCNLATDTGQQLLYELLVNTDIFLDDTPTTDRAEAGLDPEALMSRHEQLVYLSVLPFGSFGKHTNYVASEINLFHAGGEGYLMPNGLALELYPDRPPIKAYGHFAEFVGGTSAVVAGLAALLAHPEAGGQFVDVAVQDANVALSAFAVQRYGEGVLETRATRSFRYGGVLECRDGHVEVLTLEQKQWEALVELMGKPEWATAEELQDPLERGHRGSEINVELRRWAKNQNVGDVVRDGQALGVPIAKYSSPGEVFKSPQARARELFAPVAIPGAGTAEMFVAPFAFPGRTLPLRRAAGDPGQDNHAIWSEWLGHSDEEVAAWRAAGVV